MAFAPCTFLLLLELKEICMEKYICHSSWKSVVEVTMLSVPTLNMVSFEDNKLSYSFEEMKMERIITMFDFKVMNCTKKWRIRYEAV